MGECAVQVGADGGGGTVENVRNVDEAEVLAEMEHNDSPLRFGEFEDRSERLVDLGDLGDGRGGCGGARNARRCPSLARLTTTWRRYAIGCSISDHRGCAAANAVWTRSSASCCEPVRRNPSRIKARRFSRYTCSMPVTGSTFVLTTSTSSQTVEALHPVSPPPQQVDASGKASELSGHRTPPISTTPNYRSSRSYRSLFVSRGNFGGVSRRVGAGLLPGARGWS